MINFFFQSPKKLVYKCLMNNLKAGIAKGNITPKIGIPMDGFAAKRRYSNGIHDAIQAKAIVLDNGKKTVAIVSCDLCWLDNKIVSITKDLIKNQTNISKDNIILAATHTHSGPAILPLLVAPTKKTVEYVKELPNRIACIVNNACRNMKEAKIGAAKGEVSGLTQNRCIHNEPIDPELNVIYINGLTDNLKAVLINYSCHPVVLGSKNRLISADFPGYCTSIIEKNLGKNSMALFLNGACGDINPITCKGYFCDGTFQDVEQMGNKLAKETLQIIQKIKCTSKVNIDVLREEIKFQSISSIHSYLRLLRDNFSRWIFWLNMKSVYVFTKGIIPTRFLVKGDPFFFKNEVEVKILFLNDIFLVGIPGELFVQFGLDIKINSDVEYVIISSYTNGYEGYMPTLDAFRRRCYETGLFCWLPEGAGEKISNAIVDSINKYNKEMKVLHESRYQG